MHHLLPADRRHTDQDENEGNSAGEEVDSRESNAEAILSAWEMVDFHHFQDSLKDQVEQLITLEEERREKRKDIAKRTREFKSAQSSDDALKANALELVKLYQDAYELVSTEAKFGSNAFLTAFKILRNLPDPAAPVMKQCTSELTALQARVRVLEEREESLSHALRVSREKNRGMDELKQEREVFQSKLQLDGEAILESERLKSQELMAQQMLRFEEEANKMQIQLDYANEEIERLKTANAELEDAQNASMLAPPTPQQRQQAAAAAVDVSQLVETARNEGFATAQAQFLSKITALTDDNEKVSRKFLSQIDLLQSHLSQSMEHISELKAELGTRPTLAEFENIKNQLAVISRLQQTGSCTSAAAADNAGHTVLDDLGSGGGGAAGPDYLDGLSSFLLATNQRLVAELQQAKDELARANAAADGASSSPFPARSTSPPAQELDDVTINSAALKAQRDRLRAKLEKRDLEIEQFTNKLEAQESANRRLNDDMEKLRQRLRFLQSYKVSEKSTLLSGIVQGDVESQQFLQKQQQQHELGPNSTTTTAGLGRGVGHQFRTFYDAAAVRRITREQKCALLCGVVYIILLHMWAVAHVFNVL